MALTSEIIVDSAALLADDLIARCGDLDGSALLRVLLAKELPGRIALVSSFGAESAVLLAMAAEIDPAVPVIFLDTGKLFGETLTYRDKLVRALGLTNVQTFRPDPGAEARDDAKGALWRDDPDACCALRKVEPLERALSGYAGWITGRKRFQSATRAALPTIEVEDGRIKINPLANWDAKEIEAEFKRRDLPRHPLVADGFLSIGCMPCTARVAPGADARSGRWAGLDKTECGIHLPRIAPNPPAPAVRHLAELENQSVYILREAFARLPRLAMLWSGGKDSNVLIALARKAFYGRVPFPVVELDAGSAAPSVQEFRDRYAAEWGLDFRVEDCRPGGDSDPALSPAALAVRRRSVGLMALVRREKLNGVIVGVRRDDQGVQADGRVFSPHDGRGDGDAPMRRPAEFWDHYAARVAEGEYVHIHPLLGWTELDIWRYTKAESLPVAPAYLARNGIRYRSLGAGETGRPIASDAASIDAIIAELETGGAPDREAGDFVEGLRRGGSM